RWMDWAVPVWRSRTQSGAIATSLAGGATVAERIAHDHRAGRPPHCTILVLPHVWFGSMLLQNSSLRCERATMPHAPACGFRGSLPFATVSRITITTF